MLNPRYAHFHQPSSPFILCIFRQNVFLKLLAKNQPSRKVARLFPTFVFSQTCVVFLS